MDTAFPQMAISDAPAEPDALGVFFTIELRDEIVAQLKALGESVATLELDHAELLRTARAVVTDAFLDSHSWDRQVRCEYRLMESLRDALR